MRNSLLIILTISLILSSVYAYAKFGLDFSLGLGSGNVTVGPPSPSCGLGYESLIDSNGVTVQDSLGVTICLPE